MLPLKLVRSLVLRENFNVSHNPNVTDDDNNDEDDDYGEGEGDGDGDGGDNSVRRILQSSGKSRTRTRSDEKIGTSRTRTALLFFVPTRELISDTYRLSTIARDLGMDLYPTPSLSHIIFSFPPSPESPSPSPSPPSFSSSHPSTWSSASLSSSLSWSLPNDAVMLSFPSLSASSLSHLRSFVSLSNGLFKLVFAAASAAAVEKPSGDSKAISNWDCCSFSLFSRVTGERVGSMEAFSRALAANGWTFYKTRENPSPDSGRSGGKSAYLFRKEYSGRLCVKTGNGSYRVRELRLPQLDFRNAPLRILQYLLLMTDDVFFLG